MRFQELYLRCNNLKAFTNVIILEEGKESLMRAIGEVYDSILNRKVNWFSIKNDSVIIKLYYPDKQGDNERS